MTEKDLFETIPEENIFQAEDFGAGTPPGPNPSPPKTPPKRPEKTVSKSRKMRHEAGSPQDLFTSGFLKGVVLLMIVSFNAMVLKNSFLWVHPSQGFSGNMELDALLYGIGISIMMVVILFHEESWNKAFCPGAITLYLNALILVLYTHWFDWMLGEWWTKWLMSGLLTFTPVLGLWMMVKMLKR